MNGIAKYLFLNGSKTHFVSTDDSLADLNSFSSSETNTIPSKLESRGDVKKFSIFLNDLYTIYSSWSLSSCTMFFTIDILPLSLTQLSLTFSLSWNLSVFTIVYCKSVKGPRWCSFFRTGNDGLTTFMLVRSDRRRIIWVSGIVGFRTVRFQKEMTKCCPNCHTLLHLLRGVLNNAHCIRPCLSQKCH